MLVWLVENWLRNWGYTNWWSSWRQKSSCISSLLQRLCWTEICVGCFSLPLKSTHIELFPCLPAAQIGNREFGCIINWYIFSFGREETRCNHGIIKGPASPDGAPAAAVSYYMRGVVWLPPKVGRIEFQMHPCISAVRPVINGWSLKKSILSTKMSSTDQLQSNV